MCALGFNCSCRTPASFYAIMRREGAHTCGGPSGLLKSLLAELECSRCVGGRKGDPDVWLPEGVSFGVLY